MDYAVWCKAHSMLLPKETIRHPEKDDFWAQLNPLTLLRIECVGELANGGGPGCFTAYTWSPNGECAQGCYVEFKPLFFRHLWFHDIHSRESIRSYDVDQLFREAQVGDVWLVRTEFENHDGLIFIGPETTSTKIHIVADWAPRIGPTNPIQYAQLYQPGPGQRNPPPRSSYDHLRNPSV